MSLFAEDVKENFFVGVTNFYPLNARSIPNIINSLSGKDSFYYNTILRDEREDNLRRKWYFASENEIITNYSIEGNEDERRVWNKTEEQIIFYIEQIIKNARSKLINESREVIKHRAELATQIAGIKEKIQNILMEKRQICEYNNEQQKKYLDEIEHNELIIEEHEQNRILSIKKIDEINERIKEINDKTIEIKRIVYIKKDTEKNNTICNYCHNNCHLDCNCSSNDCHIFEDNNYCSVCNHGISNHMTIDYKFEKEEEIVKENDKSKISDDKIREILDLEKLKKEESQYIEMIDNIKESLTKILLEINDKKMAVTKKINEYSKEKADIEVEIIKSLNQIKINLDYLRKKSLNKELSQTMEKYIGEMIEEAQNAGDFEKKRNFELFYKIYKELIEVENIDISELNTEIYKEIKNRIISNKEN